MNLTPTVVILIYDYRGKEFYNTRDLKKVRKFNLPEGTYYVASGNFKKLRRPVKFPKSKYYRKERDLGNKDYKITFALNPNKATIYHNKALIVFDTSFRHKPLYEIIFILYHEIGHQYYYSEHKTDHYARNKMLEKGYNPSQIGKGILFSLSGRQLNRKELLVNSLL